MEKQNKGNNMEVQIVGRKSLISDMRRRLDDIIVCVSWREIARYYFGRSSSWLYHKMDGIDGNGGVGGFTEEEAEKMKIALYDLSERIKMAADRI